jgi:hypothetical protein
LKDHLSADTFAKVSAEVPDADHLIAAAQTDERLPAA